MEELLGLLSCLLLSASRMLQAAQGHLESLALWPVANTPLTVERRLSFCSLQLGVLAFSPPVLAKAHRLFREL